MFFDSKEAAEKRKRDGINVSENIKKTKRLTAGVLAANGVHSLDHPDFLKPFWERQADKAAKVLKSNQALRGKIKKGIEAVSAMRMKYGHERTHLFAAFKTKDECAVYLQYKKIAGDKGMPKDLEGRRARCIQWMCRESPTVSPHESDEEGPGSDDATPETVATLLTLASTALVNERCLMREMCWRREMLMGRIELASYVVGTFHDACGA